MIKPKEINSKKYWFIIKIDLTFILKKFLIAVKSAVSNDIIKISICDIIITEGGYMPIEIRDKGYYIEGSFKWLVFGWLYVWKMI